MAKRAKSCDLGWFLSFYNRHGCSKTYKTAAGNHAGGFHLDWGGVFYRVGLRKNPDEQTGFSLGFIGDSVSYEKRWTDG